MQGDLGRTYEIDYFAFLVQLEKRDNKFNQEWIIINNKHFAKAQYKVGTAF